MFEEAQLYSPVTQRTTARSSSTSVPTIPGFEDAAYRERRNEIAASALAWRPATRPAPIAYTDAENEVWRPVCAELAVKHERYAVRELPRRQGRARRCPTDRVPQLDEVTARPGPADRLRLPPGPRDRRRCASSTARSATGVFHSTQYVRHPSQPLYTPEPDIIHEVIGHGNMLGSPALRARSSAPPARPPSAWRPTPRCSSIADVFWFTLEFGVLYEDGELRAYGAGILSSYGEIEEFRDDGDPARSTSRRWRRVATTSPPTSRSCSRRASLGELVDERGRLLRRLRRRHAGPAGGGPQSARPATCRGRRCSRRGRGPPSR